MIFFTKWKQKKIVRSRTLVAPLKKRPLCRRVCTAAVAATVEKQQAPSNFKMSLAKAKNALSYPSKEVASNDKLWLTTLQSVRNARLSQQRFWHCHENRITKTIPHNLYVSFKSASIYCWESSRCIINYGETDLKFPYRLSLDTHIGYHWNRLEKPTLKEVPKPLLTEFGIGELRAVK